MAVKTNKEYTAMLHEIQVAEEQIRGEEDKILEVMEEMEGQEKDLKDAEQEMLKQCADIRENIRKANESIPSLEEDLAKMRAEKALMESRVNPELLLRYRRIADARKGVALAEAKDELCSACHIRIRPQMYADLLRTKTSIPVTVVPEYYSPGKASSFRPHYSLIPDQFQIQDLGLNILVYPVIQ
jgi:predicted  nucleic acid-binding Zn-ribbon protein